ncbi:hypothetical protein GCM10022261_18550 [Brevibacterium daeguense]|uniref:HTH araC/xylS-type domain-containing protein n=1 Tax=Brevibacterium daeguense TaxID=909936 RepID=A0ABP8EK52_9MICO
MRFERAVGLLRAACRGSGMTPTEVALACGYADQAHLCREVAQLAGCSPGQLIAGDVPVAPEAL